MPEFNGRGHMYGTESVLPFYGYRKYIRFIYKILMFQISLFYMFYSFGILFSFQSFHDHILGLYSLLFATSVLGVEFGCIPIKNIVYTFFPSLAEDLVKFSLFFLIGIPSIFNDYSFHLKLGSILLTIIGFFGTLVSFRYENILSSYINYYDVEHITSDT